MVLELKRHPRCFNRHIDAMGSYAFTDARGVANSTAIRSQKLPLLVSEKKVILKEEKK